MSRNRLSERLKKRLSKDREMTAITLRIPVDVVESMKEIAPLKEFTGYQTLLKSYISEGLRHDEALYSLNRTSRNQKIFTAETLQTQRFCRVMVWFHPPLCFSAPEASLR
ncbi:MAG: hypothetical protein WC091_14165 [Sulfuricellaceae bacterium]